MLIKICWLDEEIMLSILLSLLLRILTFLFKIKKQAKAIQLFLFQKTSLIKHPVSFHLKAFWVFKFYSCNLLILAFSMKVTQCHSTQFCLRCLTAHVPELSSHYNLIKLCVPFPIDRSLGRSLDSDREWAKKMQEGESLLESCLSEAWYRKRFLWLKEARNRAENFIPSNSYSLVRVAQLVHFLKTLSRLSIYTFSIIPYVELDVNSVG